MYLIELSWAAVRRGLGYTSDQTLIVSLAGINGRTGQTTSKPLQGKTQTASQRQQGSGASFGHAALEVLTPLNFAFPSPTVVAG